jgi:transcriptional regulator with XRE-family HTH domain
MTFNEKLLSLRRKSGLSQEELAEKLDVSRQAVSRWENGETLPDAQNLLVLSDIFGVTTDYLLRNGTETEKSEEKEAPAPTVNNTYIQKNSVSVFSQIIRILYIALPAVFIGASGYLAKDSALAMLIYWLVAVFIQFTVTATQKNDLLASSQKERKTFFEIGTAVNIFISAASIVIFFADLPVFNIFIYVVLVNIYAILAFEETLFHAGKSSYLKELRLKFYRLNMWFFTPALAALSAKTVLLFVHDASRYLLFSGILSALLVICACVFALLQKSLKEASVV